MTFGNVKITFAVFQLSFSEWGSIGFVGGSPIEEFDGICISRRNIGISNILIYSYLSLVCFNFSFDVNAVLLRRNRNIIQNQ